MAFNGFIEVPSHLEKREPTDEIFAYVGCVHGGDDLLVQQLGEMEEQPPDHVIFTGDIAGSPEMEELKRRFYNLVYNRAKPLLSLNSEMSDGEILAYSEGQNAPLEARTLRDGYIALFKFQRKLEGFADEIIDQQCASLTSREIAMQIRHIASFPYYGNWVANLSASVRRGVLQTIETSAERLVKPIDRLREQKTKITIVSGNWDGKNSGLGVIAGNDITPFSTKQFLAKHEIPFVQRPEILETNNVLHSLFPYDSLLSGVTEGHLRNLSRRAVEARDQGKAVIMVGHAEANWKVHTLPISRPAPNPPERDATIANFGHAMSRLRPDQVVYSHQHDRIRDEMRMQVGLNAKYILQTFEENVRLVEDQAQVGGGPHNILVTHVPLMHIAYGIYAKIRAQNVFAGTQRPIVIKSR